MKPPDPTAIFCLCCIAWGLVVALLIGGCGAGQRPCADLATRGSGDRATCEQRRGR